LTTLVYITKCNITKEYQAFVWASNMSLSIQI